MGEVLVLDTGPAGKIAHPRANQGIAQWLEARLYSGDTFVLPEVVDYELRRNFLLELERGKAHFRKSLDRLDELRQVLRFLPIDSDIMLKAAEFWARARSTHRPTADNKELDIDVILAAQAVRVNGTVLTENPGHLSLFVPVRNWVDR